MKPRGEVYRRTEGSRERRSPRRRNRSRRLHQVSPVRVEAMRSAVAARGGTAGLPIPHEAIGIAWSPEGPAARSGRRGRDRGGRREERADLIAGRPDSHDGTALFGHVSHRLHRFAGARPAGGLEDAVQHVRARAARRRCEPKPKKVQAAATSSMPKPIRRR